MFNSFFQQFFGNTTSSSSAETKKSTKKRCYYELLGVERDASESDLKKAYRSMALRLHPDKNMDRVEEATREFTEIQLAYEVLMDPQERAWYDAHRNQILNDNEESAQYSETVGLSTQHLLKFFTTSCFSGFHDGPDGFYTVYKMVFAEILRNEQSAVYDDDALAFSLPDVSFGSSTVTFDQFFYTDSRQETSLKDFYSVFGAFSSCRSFRECDKYRIPDAPDRNVRRWMEKENAKLRESARREFSQTVCDLTAFVKKRDPRVKEYQKLTEERRLAALQAQKERNKMEKMKRLDAAGEYVEPEWTRAESEYVDEDDLFRRRDLGGNVTDKDEMFFVEEDGVLLCIACDKTFKNDRQMQNHEYSKKHLLNVEKLKKEMLEEDAYLQAHADDAADLKERDSIGEHGDGYNHEASHSLQDISDDEIYTPVRDIPTLEVSEDEQVDWTIKKGNKKGNKKARKNKQQKPSEESIESEIAKLNLETEFYCNVCNAGHPSKTKLFEHIRSTGHALAVPEKKTKKKKRK